jgi:HSP20 family protein
MSIWTWGPGWDPLGELQRQVDRLFDFTTAAGPQVSQGWRQFPALNFYETAHDYLLVAALPGASPAELEITTVGRSLTLKGERRRGTAADEHYRREERWMGKWSRSLQVPDKADLSQVSATLENGLLTVRLPKVPESQPRQVPVIVRQPTVRSQA